MRTALLLIILLFTSTAPGKDLSLEEIRGQLLNQEVIVLGRGFGDRGSLSGTLVEWYLVTGDEKTGFKGVQKSGGNAPETLRGKRGIVVSVEEAELFLSSKKVGEKDAFGKPIDASRVMNPYIDVVVKMLDGDVLIGTKTFYTILMSSSLHLASRADSLKKEIDSYLVQLINKKLYKTGYTELANSALSLKDLLDDNKRGLARDYETKNLTPLKVVEAKLLEAENAIVLKVELPDRDTRLLFGKLDFYDLGPAGEQTRLQRMQIYAEEKIPTKFAPKELVAIKDGKIFRGMSEDALYWSWGYPEKSNDWGRGGKQHIYHGSQYVYVEGKTVRDWQAIK